MKTLLINKFLKKLPKINSVMLLDKIKTNYDDRFSPKKLIIIADNIESWHSINYKMNKKHYPWGSRFTSVKVAKFIQARGAKVFYNQSFLDMKKNNLIENTEFEIYKDEEKINELEISEIKKKKYFIKYGIMDKDEFKDDLENWTYFKVPSYLFMPNNFFVIKSKEIEEAVKKNYFQAV